MLWIVLHVLMLNELFYFFEGKPCPEKTRFHKTRCDAFYECKELSSRTHIWVPQNCEQGLVYEHSVGLCVLPSEDWECLLGETQFQEFQKLNKVTKKDESDVVTLENRLTKPHIPLNDYNVEIIFDEILSTEKGLTNNTLDVQQDEDIYSGDGEINSVNKFHYMNINKGESIKPECKEIHEHKMELKNLNNVTRSNSEFIDSNLKVHLQRLSQLIDGLKVTYQKTDQKQNGLRPDQLNAFLAHFNIKNQFDSLIPDENYKMDQKSSTTTLLTSVTNTEPIHNTLHLLTNVPVAGLNKTRLQDHTSSNILKPETKVVLANGPTSSYNQGHEDEYTNSQIVVNGPEGSILFTLPNYANEQNIIKSQSESQSYLQNDYMEPKISEETLKTVIELSKQMIAAQNVPRVIPNPVYYAPKILQPVIVTPSQQSPFLNYYTDSNVNGALRQYVSYSKQNSGHKQFLKNLYQYNKPSTTIIHNNVIPVHVSATNSDEKEVVDSNGNNFGVYPLLQTNEAIKLKNTQNNNIYKQHMHYGNKKFVTTVATARPTPSFATISTQHTGQYPSPYTNEFTLTTPRPFNQQPTAETISAFYTPNPHLNENNVNQIFQIERYPALNVGNILKPFGINSPPQSYLPTNDNMMFPSIIDVNQVKIRPNSQKIESIEADTDEMISAQSSNFDINTLLSQSEILTHSSTRNKTTSTSDMTGQLTHSSYVDHSLKHPNILKPSTNLFDYDSGNGNHKLDLSSESTSTHFDLKPSVMQYANTISSSNPNLYNDGEAQIVNFGGNFINFDVFQNSILPLISQSNANLNHVEVITCQAGIRQPNVTDCTRYFVCSKKDGKILNYSCPPYTAFNSESRICDAKTYAYCNSILIKTSYTMNQNKHLHMEALKALQNAMKKQELSFKTHNIANLIKLFNSRNSNILENVNTTTTTKPTSMPLRKRKYYCKEGEKIPNQTSVNSYFVCYKNAQGIMKGHKMSCSTGLLFCPKTAICTLPVKCA